MELTALPNKIPFNLLFKKNLNLTISILHLKGLNDWNEYHEINYQYIKNFFYHFVVSKTATFYHLCGQLKILNFKSIMD